MASTETWLTIFPVSCRLSAARVTSGAAGRALTNPWRLNVSLQPARACAAFERAADPLHRARIDTELFGNDVHTWPSRGRQGLCW